jgi:L-fuculose-phosphate aldolase
MRDLRERIVEIGRRLYERGLIGANEGNVSARDGDVLLVTPASVCKGYLTPDMIVETDIEGRKRGDGPGRVSSEVAMHVACYRRRPDITAVVHAHPPTATGFAVAGIALDRPLIAEAVVTLGAVRVIPYGTPSTQELADNVGSAICESHAVLMANHGALSVGDSVERAWERMETIEQLARVTLTTRLLGQDNLLSPGDVERLERLRTGAGYPPPVCVDCPSCGGSVPMAEGDTVVLTREQLVGLISDALQRFGQA